eukprot:838529-Pelagomonas_calceolata.AAC.1
MATLGHHSTSSIHAKASSFLFAYQEEDAGKAGTIASLQAELEDARNTLNSARKGHFHVHGKSDRHTFPSIRFVSGVVMTSSIPGAEASIL